MKFKKKPVVIEAFQWDPSKDSPYWLLEAFANRIVKPELDGSVTIQTLEGYHRGEIGDWIIRGIKGELFPC